MATELTGTGHKEASMRRLTKFWGIIAIGAVMTIGMAGCDGFLTTPDENGNRPLDYTKTYAFYNNSSYTVTLEDSTDTTVYLKPGDNTIGRFNAEISVDDVYYSPAYLVKVAKTGATSFTFTDRE
jgi:hypothetical protein